MTDEFCVVQKYYVRWPLNHLLEGPIFILLIISFCLSTMTFSLALASSTTGAHSFLSKACVHHLFTPQFLRSDSASSICICLGIPFVLHPPGLPSSILYYYMPKPSQTMYFNYGYSVCRSFSPSLKKKSTGVFTLYPSECIVSEKMDVIILVVLKAHHTLTAVSHNGTLHVSVRLSVDQNLLFWVFTWPYKEPHMQNKLASIVITTVCCFQI